MRPARLATGTTLPCWVRSICNRNARQCVRDRGVRQVAQTSDTMPNPRDRRRMTAHRTIDRTGSNGGSHTQKIRSDVRLDCTTSAFKGGADVSDRKHLAAAEARVDRASADGPVVVADPTLPSVRPITSSQRANTSSNVTPIDVPMSTIVTRPPSPRSGEDTRALGDHSSWRGAFQSPCDGRGGSRSPSIPPSTASTVPVVDADRGDAR